jgi:hypothetical protein
MTVTDKGNKDESVHGPEFQPPLVNCSQPTPGISSSKEKQFPLAVPERTRYEVRPFALQS